MHYSTDENAITFPPKELYKFNREPWPIEFTTYLRWANGSIGARISTEHHLSCTYCGTSRGADDKVYFSFALYNDDDIAFDGDWSRYIIGLGS